MQKENNKEISGASAKKIKVLITIVDRDKALYYEDLLESYDVNISNTIYGEGTAPSALGLTDKSKACIISVINEDRIKEVCSVLNEKFMAAKKKGKGIAFTVPISSVIGVLTYGFLSNQEV